MKFVKRAFFKENLRVTTSVSKKIKQVDKYNLSWN